MLATAALLTFLATPAAAQDPADPNPGGLTISGGLDFANSYIFRGIRQQADGHGFVMAPFVDVGGTLYTGEGSLRSFGVNFGTWNSVHIENATGTQNPRNRQMWYESDLYVTLSFGLPGNITSGLTYTAYNSPNGGFQGVKEMSFKVGIDDSRQLGRYSLKPYGLIAMEMDTATGGGACPPGCLTFRQPNGAVSFSNYPKTGNQADGGASWGTYLELGVMPGYALENWNLSLAVPIKTGLSLNNYYEIPVAGRDNKFGFASIAGVVTAPFTAMPTSFGTWNIHGGVEGVFLGDGTRFAAGENDSNGKIKRTEVVYSLGLGFTY